MSTGWYLSTGWPVYVDSGTPGDEAVCKSVEPLEGGTSLEEVSHWGSLEIALPVLLPVDLSSLVNTL